MFFFDWLKKETAVGLDISDAAIELAQLERRPAGVRLASLNRLLLPSGVVASGKILDPIKLKELLLKAFREAKPHPIGGHKVIFGLPERHLFIHQFAVPAAIAGNTLALTALANEEAGKYVPLPLERQIVFSKKMPGERALVLVIDREAVSHWHDFFRSAGIGVTAFDLESLATWRGINAKPYSKPVCLFDLGAHTSTVAFFNAGGLAYTYVSRLAGDYLTQKLVTELKLAPPAAEALKIKNGLIGADSAATKALKTALAPLVTELGSSLKAIAVWYGAPVEKLVLAGGTARLPGLAEFLKQELGVETIVPVVADFLIQSGTHRRLFFDEAHLYLEAIGLALRGFKNFSAGPDPYLPLG